MKKQKVKVYKCRFRFIPIWITNGEYHVAASIKVKIHHLQFTIGTSTITELKDVICHWDDQLIITDDRLKEEVNEALSEWASEFFPQQLDEWIKAFDSPQAVCWEVV